MLILVSGATKTVRAAMARERNLGVLLTPNDGNAIPDDGIVWAADNSAFSGFNRARFLRFIDRLARARGCRWVTCPDVVGDALATRALWEEWRPFIVERGLPPALVAQDGLREGDVPWDEVACVFIGGTTQYKLSGRAAAVVAEARRRGVWAHMGRVNTARRIRFAAALGCDSVDGTAFSRFSATHLPWALQVARQIPLAERHGDLRRVEVP